MPDPITNELLFEIMKAGQADVAVMCREVGELKADMATLSAEHLCYHLGKSGAFFALRARIMRARKAENRLEPFSGSGTTIIAAEMTGRCCHAIELSLASASGLIGPNGLNQPRAALHS
jgi:hypothetical protein